MRSGPRRHDVSAFAGQAGRSSNLPVAIGWMMLALVSFSLVAITGRAASKGLTTIELMFVRSWIGAALLLLFMLVTGRKLDLLLTSRMPLHLTRIVIHFGAQYSWLAALTMIPLAELFAIEFTAPLWVALIAPLVLREQLTPIRLTASMLGFVGVMVVVQPGLLAGQVGVQMSTGSLLALASAFGFAFSMVATKLLTRTEPVLRILVYMHVFQGVIAGLLLPNGLPWPPLDIFLWAAGVAVAGLSAHVGLTMAFARADVIIVAPLDFFRLPLMAAVGVYLYGEPLTSTLALGASVVVSGNALNIWAEQRAQRMRSALQGGRPGR